MSEKSSSPPNLQKYHFLSSDDDDDHHQHQHPHHHRHHEELHLQLRHHPHHLHHHQSLIQDGSSLSSIIDINNNNNNNNSGNFPPKLNIVHSKSGSKSFDEIGLDECLMGGDTIGAATISTTSISTTSTTCLGLAGGGATATTTASTSMPPPPSSTKSLNLPSSSSSTPVSSMSLPSPLNLHSSGSHDRDLHYNETEDRSEEEEDEDDEEEDFTDEDPNKKPISHLRTQKQQQQQQQQPPHGNSLNDIDWDSSDDEDEAGLRRYHFTQRNTLPAEFENATLWKRLYQGFLELRMAARQRRAARLLSMRSDSLLHKLHLCFMTWCWDATDRGILLVIVGTFVWLLLGFIFRLGSTWWWTGFWAVVVRLGARPIYESMRKQRLRSSTSESYELGGGVGMSIVSEPWRDRGSPAKAMTVV